MSRYFTHIENGGGAQRDDTGTEFASPVQAIGEAAKMAGELLRADVGHSLADHRLTVRVEGDGGKPVGVITVVLSLAALT